MSIRVKRPFFKHEINWLSLPKGRAWLVQTITPNTGQHLLLKRMPTAKWVLEILHLKV
jgi:hypothetical protein